MSVTIRKARIKDVKAVHAMLLNCTDGLVLPRSFNQLYSHLRDFFVAVDDTDNTVGCCALSICWEDLGEIRSLFVVPELRGTGLARKLIEACISEALTLGIYRVFTLTDKPAFFVKQGFDEVGKEVLPQKVWADCINCPRFPDCDEVPLLMNL